jgi:hypothetical protein
MFHRALAYLISVLHPYTFGRSMAAVGRGILVAFVSTSNWVSATDRPHLREANATLHHSITQKRAWAVGTAVFWDVCALVASWYFVPNLGFLWLPTGIWTWVASHLIVLFLIGRQEPVMQRVQTPWTAGESLIRRIVDDITATAESKKMEEGTQILQPVRQLSNGKGYDVVVRIADHGNADKMETAAKTIARKLHKQKGTVIVSIRNQDLSTFRVMVLNEDPWAAKPTVHPLVANPRPVDLWAEDAELGTLPDSSPYSRRLVEEGDGGGMCFGGAPRAGKTILIGNLLVPIMLHTGSRLHIIDGKAVDFESVRPIAATFLGDPDMTDRALLAGATKVLQMLQTEVNRRRKILLPLEIGHVTAELCAEYGMMLEWLVIDELAVITEDLMSTARKEVQVFTELLQWLVRMGPAFGVFCILATQRPSSISVPVAIRDLIVFRAALYIGSFSGSQAILGKAGPANRADWLDPDQKGVAIVTRVGQMRSHLVKPKDLKKVALYAAALRGAGPAPDPGTDFPEPVRSIMEIFQDEDEDKDLPSWAILRGLNERDMDYSFKSLAAALRPYGIESTLVGPKREAGYRLADLKTVPRVRLHRLRESGPDRPGEGDGEASPMAANYSPEDES